MLVCAGDGKETAGGRIGCCTKFSSMNGQGGGEKRGGAMRCARLPFRNHGSLGRQGRSKEGRVGKKGRDRYWRGDGPAIFFPYPLCRHEGELLLEKKLSPTKHLAAPAV